MVHTKTRVQVDRPDTRKWVITSVWVPEHQTLPTVRQMSAMRLTSAGFILYLFFTAVRACVCAYVRVSKERHAMINVKRPDWWKAPRADERAARLQRVQTNRWSSVRLSLSGDGELQAAKRVPSIRHSWCANNEGWNEWCCFSVIAAVGEACSEHWVQQQDGPRGEHREEREGWRGGMTKCWFLM